MSKGDGQIRRIGAISIVVFTSIIAGGCGSPQVEPSGKTAVVQDHFIWRGIDQAGLGGIVSDPGFAQASGVGGAQAVVFGGLTDEINPQGNGKMASGQTWVWTGSTFANACQISCVGPSPRVGSTMAYDPRINEVILFGGLSFGPDGQPIYDSDTWEWNGDTWSDICSNSCISPAAREDASMAFDPSSGDLILFGGVASGQRGLTDLSDTWLWNGTAWSDVCSNACNEPPPRDQAAITTDPLNNGVLLFGGSTANVARDDTWIWSDMKWTHTCLLACSSPPSSPNPSMTFSAGIGGVVMVDNQRFGSPTSETVTWLWTGKSWKDLCSGTCSTTNSGPAEGYLVSGEGSNQVTLVAFPLTSNSQPTEVELGSPK